jgi:outer membrane protein OmpA-like peptidoglycan-associated protein
MNTTIQNITFSKTLIATAVASLLLAACATAPVQPPGSAEVRSRLTQLQADPKLGSLAPVAIKEADVAVRAAETPETDAGLASHRVFMADRKVETARAQAETRFAEDQRPALSEQRESARLDSRTREADLARIQVAVARADSAGQKLAADEARGAANAAQVAATSSERQAAELQRQIDELNAKPTDRGLVVTLGDVLFTSGQADLKAGATGNLNKLVTFLNEYPSRTVMIEGYTDNVGSEDYNQGLSQRRADSVKTYLVEQGIGSIRLIAAGKGEYAPVAGNDSAAGRQQNRRVEVIINTPAAALR